MTARKGFEELLKPGAEPVWLGDAWRAFDEGLMFSDPVTLMDTADFSKGTTGKCPWGITWRKEESDPGPVPIVTDETRVIKDITRWRDTAVFPEIQNLDWSEFDKAADTINREEKFIMVPTYAGMFERAHFLLGFEDLFLAIYEEPEALEELLSAITDWKIEVVRLLIEHAKPDVIHSHDDWGNRTSLFMSPDLWRKTIRPHYERFYGYIAGQGVIIQHHADCYCQGLETDMVELGVGMWQGVIPANDIRLIRQNTQGRLLMMGGIDQTLFDFTDYREDAIRREVRRAIDEYSQGGSFVPMIASMYCIYPEVDAIARDEMNRYGQEWLEKNRNRRNP